MRRVFYRAAGARPDRTLSHKTSSALVQGLSPYTHAHTHTHTHIHSDTHTHSHTYTLTYTHTHITHTHRYTRTHTNPFLHVLKCKHCHTPRPTGKEPGATVSVHADCVDVTEMSLH